ncbi:TauD/TfdA dioxygenase family protein [Pseudonocardia sp.]|uniref:TauD/TfdA dioxygenase family protein n=1 Tax=Pseudonocardia sp. TaxID=60912 RepID=UPI003D0F4604
MTQQLEIVPVGSGIGAEVVGLDLGLDFSDETYSRLRTALDENGVLFVPDQDLTVEQHQGLARRFGDLLTTQELRKEADETQNIGDTWHVDGTYTAAPPAVTLLVARELPRYGGDTIWASMRTAYDALSESLKDTLEGLSAVHANVRGLTPSSAATVPPEPSVDAYDDAEGVLHPVVISHPGGFKSLFVNPAYTARFEGWTRRESLGLLNYLFQHCQRPEFSVRLHWRPGMVAIWDNTQVWHLAVNDYHGLRRVMSRAVVAGAPLKAAR